MSEDRLKGLFSNTASSGHWERLGYKKRSGILAPLFSVFSRNSCGIGDFSDIKFLVDLANKTGNSIIQFLPLNETGPTFCPYDSLSSFALDPAYLSLTGMVAAKVTEKLRIKYPLSETHVDYHIKQDKMDILYDVFNDKDCLESGFLKFNEENSYWLEDFALFKVLKQQHNNAAWYEWGQPYKSRDKKELESFSKSHKKQILFQKWVQYLLYQQLSDARKYAKSKRVLLKGDLPILVSRDSSDVWSHPEFFKLDFAAGAPPDMYCAKGQRWGMPTYNWNVIASEGYRYLKEKLRYAENFYDILRVDHVVGLFRIWSISYNEPKENIGLNGFFDPPDEGRWREHGRNILSLMLNSSNMLLCAEDLGVIPRSCTETLHELGIPGNEVQRWVKDWNIRHDFLKPHEYRLMSVVMLSTHDTTSFCGWWEYEAGTVDEALFIRRCSGRVDYEALKLKLFDMNMSRHGRLRWLNNLDSVDKLCFIMGRKKEELMDFVDMYLNTYHEKEKLWDLMGLGGFMLEKCDSRIVKEALRISLQAESVFCVNTIIDWLGLSDILKDDSYEDRINTPGTISNKNWSLRLPLPLEDLLAHKICGQIKEMVVSSGRE